MNQITQYRKKPVVIEARKINLMDYDEASSIVGWAGGHANAGGFTIPTLEGIMQVSDGDWVIKGVKGEFYPCKPDIFEATYQAVERFAESGKSMPFGVALDFMKQGFAVARAGWNGKGMFAYRVGPNAYPAQTGIAKAHFGERAMVPYNAYYALKGADGAVSTWVPSSTDLEAEDWCVADVSKGEEGAELPFAEGVKAGPLPSQQIEERAGRLYAAYCEAVGGVAFNGDPLPDWATFRADNSKIKQSGAWIAAAKAV